MTSVDKSEFGQTAGEREYGEYLLAYKRRARDLYNSIIGEMLNANSRRRRLMQLRLIEMTIILTKERKYCFNQSSNASG